MNIFSVNQVNQVYVVTQNPKTGAGTLDNTPGGVYVGISPDNKYLYFKVVGADGSITRSDMIDISTIEYTKATEAYDTFLKYNSYTITLNSAAKKDGAPIVGQDYILRVAFNGYVGISPEDSQYWKYGVVHTYADITDSSFYAKMALSLAMNMKREPVKLMKVELTTSGDAVEVTSTTKESDLTGTYTGIKITEVEPDWLLGTKQQKIVRLEPVPGTISDGVNEVAWGVTTKTVVRSTGNGKLAADYEYFFHGERGDQYRMVGYPDYVPTKYMVNPSLNYDFITLHFSYIGDNESCQKSEKDITFLVTDHGKAIMLASAINAYLPDNLKLSFATNSDPSPTPGTESTDEETTEP